MSDIITAPIKFLGATVLSFNSTLGLGSTQESTLNVDLVEDCENGDQFWPANNLIEVGAPVYFATAVNDENGNPQGFSFGGVLTNWTVDQGGSGRTFNVKVVDPRQLLENVAVVIDSYNGPPVRTTNFFNIYALIEGGGCASGNFGLSGSTEKGTPYLSIITALKNMNPTICSPTGYNYKIDFSTFPVGVPEFYRVAGPSITISQLLQDVCGVLGLEFYVYLTEHPIFGDTISIGTVDLRAAPTSFANIIDQFDGTATQLSYGEELRNEVTRGLVFGEKQHYLSPVSKFNFYFGEEWNGNEFVPVIPHKRDKCNGFWIRKRIKELNLGLNQPIKAGNGPFEISEADIKAAMAGESFWLDRMRDEKIPGGFNAAVRATYTIGGFGPRDVFEAVREDGSIENNQKYKAFVDAMGGPNKAKKVEDLIKEDIKNIHAFVQNLGTTYYGKQFFVPLNEDICFYKGEKFQEKIFSSEPTNAGGWVDYGTPVLGLNDPDLASFRTTDDRIGCFAVFATADSDIKEDDKKPPAPEADGEYIPGGGQTEEGD